MTSAKFAPFGLEWGMTSPEVRAAGVGLQALLPDLEASQPKDGSRYAATNLPRRLPDIGGVVLEFNQDDRLWRAVALSQPFKGASLGAAELKARYYELAVKLTEAYGHERKIGHIENLKGPAKPDFFAGVMTGKSFYDTIFHAHGVDIELAIVAVDSNTGYWRLVCRSNRFSPGRAIQTEQTRVL